MSSTKKSNKNSSHAASIISGLSERLSDQDVADSLSMVDISFFCKVCGKKEVSVDDLLAHMKEQRCAKRGRGRPRKTPLPAEPVKPKTPGPARGSRTVLDGEVIEAAVAPSDGSSGAGRVTRVRSGALKRRTVHEILGKKKTTGQGEDGSSDEEISDTEEDTPVPPKRGRGRPPKYEMLPPNVVTIARTDTDSLPKSQPVKPDAPSTKKVTVIGTLPASNTTVTNQNKFKVVHVEGPQTETPVKVIRITEARTDVSSAASKVRLPTPVKETVSGANTTKGKTDEWLTTMSQSNSQLGAVGTTLKRRHSGEVNDNKASAKKARIEEENSDSNAIDEEDDLDETFGASDGSLDDSHADADDAAADRDESIEMEDVDSDESLIKVIHLNAKKNDDNSPKTDKKCGVVQVITTPTKSRVINVKSSSSLHEGSSPSKMKMLTKAVVDDDSDDANAVKDHRRKTSQAPTENHPKLPQLKTVSSQQVAEMIKKVAARGSNFGKNSSLIHVPVPPRGRGRGHAQSSRPSLLKEAWVKSGGDEADSDGEMEGSEEEGGQDAAAERSSSRSRARDDPAAFRENYPPSLLTQRGARLSHSELRIPIGHLKDGQSKIVKLQTRVGEKGPESSSLLQIKQVDKVTGRVTVKVADVTDEAKVSTVIKVKREKVDASEKDEKVERIEDSHREAEQPSHQGVKTERAEDDDDDEVVKDDEEAGQEQETVTATGDGDDADADEEGEEEEEVVYLEALTAVELVGGDDEEETVRRLAESKETQSIYNIKPTKTNFPHGVRGIEAGGGRSTYHKGSLDFKCKRCVSRCFHSAEELALHLRFHRGGRELGYACDKCEYECESWGRMLYHILSHDEYLQQVKGKPMVANVIGEFKCSQCDKVFDRKNNLLTHFKKLHYQTVRVCNHCGENFEAITDSKFQRHIDKCKGDLLQCGECNYTTSVKANMQAHMKIHAGGGFACDQCTKVFPTRQRLQTHLQKHLPAEQRPRYPCELCGADFCSMDAVKKHQQRIHVEKQVEYRCSFCSYSTKVPHDLKKHINNVHEKKYFCAIEGCDFKTNNLEKLEAHAEYHKDYMNFRCTYFSCFFASVTSKELINHMQSVHKVGYKHQCPICQKFFKKKTHLLRHLVSHTNERPYVCFDCGQSFICHSTYYRHRQKMGHDNRREGVCSVPQNISIQYLDDGGGDSQQPGGGDAVMFTMRESGEGVKRIITERQGVRQIVNFDDMAGVAPQVLLPQDPAAAELDLDGAEVDDRQVVMLDAGQLAALQAGQPLAMDEDGGQQDGCGAALVSDDAGITYYMYTGDTGEAVRLDLPSGTATVATHATDGSFTVVNTNDGDHLGTTGEQSLETVNLLHHGADDPNSVVSSLHSELKEEGSGDEDVDEMVVGGEVVGPAEEDDEGESQFIGHGGGQTMQVQVSNEELLMEAATICNNVGQQQEEQQEQQQQFVVEQCVDGEQQTIGEQYETHDMGGSGLVHVGKEELQAGGGGEEQEIQEYQLVESGGEQQVVYHQIEGGIGVTAAAVGEDGGLLLEGAALHTPSGDEPGLVYEGEDDDDANTYVVYINEGGESAAALSMLQLGQG